MIDYQSISTQALPHLPRLLPMWLPGGKIEGREYVTSNLAGGPGRSLSINLVSGLWKDFADGGGGGDVISLYAAIHGVPQGDAARKLSEAIGINGGRSHPQGKIVKTYDYNDADGNLLFQVCRKEPKSFTQRRPDGNGGWVWSVKGVDLVPYRLPEWINSPYGYLVEGEQDVDNLIALGIPATCNPMGAGKWRQEYAPYFKDKRVCIISDNDEPGRRHAEQVARSLHRIASVVKVLHLPDLPLKGDVSDWLAAGGSKEKLLELTRQTPEWELSAEPIQGQATLPEPNAEREQKAKCPRMIVPVSIADFLAMDFPPRRNLLAPWLPAQGLVMVFAARGIGKTFFSLGAAYAVACGGVFLGWQAPRPSGVLYLDGEMPGAVMQERLAALVASSQEPQAPLILVTPDLQPEGMPRLDTTEGQEAVEGILTPDIDLIVVDNISTLTCTKENEADGWTPVQAWALRQRARGRSVLFVHHSGKGGQQRGTSRREDVLDTVLNLRRPVDYEPDQGAVFEVHFEKARGLFGEDVHPIEARLSTDQVGNMTWTTRQVEACNFERVVSLLNEGMSQKDIAVELGLNKSNVSRHAKRAKQEGHVTPKARAES